MVNIQEKDIEIIVVRVLAKLGMELTDEIIALFDPYYKPTLNQLAHEPSLLEEAPLSDENMATQSPVE